MGGWLRERNLVLSKPINALNLKFQIIDVQERSVIKTMGRLDA